MTKNKKSSIGLTKGLKITVNGDNTFKVYGDAIGSGNPHSPSHPKKVKVTSVHHNWDNPSSVTDKGPDALEIKAFCHPRHANSDDDLSVTITVDAGLPTEDTTSVTFPDVDYSD